jgi:glycosyltransferase involved in cell wall biosynthesis
VRILHNPVDLEAIAEHAAEPLPVDLTADHPVVAAAGRLAQVKNYPLLIAAAAELKSTSPVHVWILGEGPERSRLEAFAQNCGVGSLVRFLGFQQNPWRFIAHADVFVLTSTYEGFGNVLIEAMACGTPVIATRSPGTLEIIEEGRNGRLVDHDARAVAGAIDELLVNGAARDTLVGRAKDGVSHYALPVVAARYERLFEELTA